MKRLPAGVYAITNTQTSERYIGSSVTPLERWGRHRMELRQGTHRCAPLQCAWDTYGADAFRFDFLTPSDNLKHDEQRIITLHRRADWPLYNIRAARNASVTTEAEMLAALDTAFGHAGTDEVSHAAD